MKKIVVLFFLVASVLFLFSESWAIEYKGKISKMESHPKNCAVCDSITVISFDDGRQVTVKGIVYGIVEIGKDHSISVDDHTAQITNIVPMK